MVAGPPTLTHCGLPVSTPTLELAMGTRHFHCLLLVAPTWYMTYIALWYKMRKIYESSISFDWTQEVPKRTQAIWKVRINLLPIASWVPGHSVARKMYPHNNTCYIYTLSESQFVPCMLNVYPVYKKYWQGVWAGHGAANGSGAGPSWQPELQQSRRMGFNLSSQMSLFWIDKLSRRLFICVFNKSSAGHFLKQRWERCQVQRQGMTGCVRPTAGMKSIGDHVGCVQLEF